MEFKFFIGIDVAKNWLDFSVLEQNKQLFYIRVDNSKSGILSVIGKLKEYKIELKNCLFCLEHTGIYNNHLLDFLLKKKTAVWVETSIRIKKSLGMLRGKNDKIDSYRIALYAFKNRDCTHLWQPPREELKKLQYLITIRARLVSIKHQLKTPMKEAKGYVDPELIKVEAKACKLSLKSVEQDLKNIEKQIKAHIKQDPQLDRLYNIITSIDGVGEVVATNIIATTNEFKNFTEAKKYACYAGVAPFEHSSGTSIRGRSRVSHMANKSIKRLIHMAALSAIKMKGELRDYYLRKVEEGKNKMGVINAVRNKLLLRIFTLVKQNRKYEKIYINTVA
jgi:transposase